jgi:RNA polymerase sigma-70 factor (ECF subfamily)
MQFLHRMPVGYKKIMNLYAIEGYSHKEIAQLLGIAESTSRSQYSRARELLINMRNQRLSPRAAEKYK